jgi:hypothetical protein
MIGPKKLSEIRQELHDALAAEVGDPIAWLEAQMTAPIQSHPKATVNEELVSLIRYLERTVKKPRRKHPARTRTKK